MKEVTKKITSLRPFDKQLGFWQSFRGSGIRFLSYEIVGVIYQRFLWNDSPFWIVSGSSECKTQRRGQIIKSGVLFEFFYLQELNSFPVLMIFQECAFPFSKNPTQSSCTHTHRHEKAIPPPQIRKEKFCIIFGKK